MHEETSKKEMEKIFIFFLFLIIAILVADLDHRYGRNKLICNTLGSNCEYAITKSSCSCDGKLVSLDNLTIEEYAYTKEDVMYVIVPEIKYPD